MPNAKVDESTLWKWLKKVEPQYGTDLHMERIENIAGKGTPDVEGWIAHVGFTIELKAVARKALIDVELSREQVWWAKRRLVAGGTHHWFLIQVGSGNDARRYFIRGSEVGHLVDPVTEARLQNLAVNGGWMEEPWWVISAIQNV